MSHRQRGGDRVGHSQLLPLKVVPDDQSPSLGQCLGLPVHPAAAEELAGGEVVQDGLQWGLLRCQRGVQQSAALRDHQGENDTVGPVQAVQAFFGSDALGMLGSTAQGVGMDSMAVLGQELGQADLALVAAQNPDIPFVFDGNDTSLTASWAAGFCVILCGGRGRGSEE